MDYLQIAISHIPDAIGYAVMLVSAIDWALSAARDEFAESDVLTDKQEAEVLLALGRASQIGHMLLRMTSKLSMLRGKR